MTSTLLVAGTASHVGKSTVASGLCRLLADRGVDVAPFKAQNMSNNARAVPRGGQHEGPVWGEIGVSQYVQAQAARIPAHVDVNPVLLKPRGDGESQLVVHGEPVEHVSTGDYYQDRWEDARDAVRESYAHLAAEHDVIVAEGAGSMAEPNLADRDLANVETARLANARIVLVADIDRGGAFAHLVGTLELAPADLRRRVIGLVLTKFRGDQSVLDPAIATVEQRTGVPVLGVLPHDDPGLPAEDSIALPSTDERVVRGRNDGISPANSVTVAVPRLPRISNFTDLEPLASEPGVRVAYVPLDGTFADADAIVVPGTKNTVDDLLALREYGMATALVEFDGPIVGLCGGYQLLGERLENVGIESTSVTGNIAGLGLLPVETRFTREKQVEAVERFLSGAGPLAGADGRIKGYEIHMGRTRPTGPVARPVGGRGAATADVFGTYLHGLFENRIARRAFCETVFRAGDRSVPSTACRDPTPIDQAADQLREYVDLGPLDLPGAPP